MCDAFLLAACVIVFFLDVSRQEKIQRTREALGDLFTIPACIVYSILFMLGILVGVRGNYYALYLQDELGASTTLLGETQTADMVKTLCGAISARQLCRRWRTRQHLATAVLHVHHRLCRHGQLHDLGDLARVFEGPHVFTDLVRKTQFWSVTTRLLKGIMKS